MVIGQVEKESVHKAEKGLGQAVYELTWAGMFWEKGGAIQLSRLRFQLLMTLGEEAVALSAFSSTYYSAAGNARARSVHAPFLDKLFWGWQALWCLWRAMRLSDRLARLIGLEGMSPDQLDIRASILRRARRYADALLCINEALRREDLRFHTKVLLLVSEGEILDVQGKNEESDRSYQRAIQLMPELEPKVLVRVLRSLALHTRRRGEEGAARVMLSRALDMAREHNLKDQIVKIQALL